MKHPLCTRSCRLRDGRRRHGVVRIALLEARPLRLGLACLCVRGQRGAVDGEAEGEAVHVFVGRDVADPADRRLRRIRGHVDCGLDVGAWEGQAAIGGRRQRRAERGRSAREDVGDDGRRVLRRAAAARAGEAVAVYHGLRREVHAAERVQEVQARRGQVEEGACEVDAPAPEASEKDSGAERLAGDQARSAAVEAGVVLEPAHGLWVEVVCVRQDAEVCGERHGERPDAARCVGDDVRRVASNGFDEALVLLLEPRVPVDVADVEFEVAVRLAQLDLRVVVAGQHLKRVRAKDGRDLVDLVHDRPAALDFVQDDFSDDALPRQRVGPQVQVHDVARLLERRRDFDVCRDELAQRLLDGEVVVGELDEVRRLGKCAALQEVFDPGAVCRRHDVFGGGIEECAREEEALRRPAIAVGDDVWDARRVEEVRA
mmetsp:Transcript_15160/g.52767  ORF Transcript_15160/g.52767 Transcript_15160/m.52767 type:complete len:430 (+) Transcript_15160:11-1300(+)